MEPLSFGSQNSLHVDFDTPDWLLDLPWEVIDRAFNLAAMREYWLEQGFCPAVSILNDDGITSAHGLVWS